jgi:hypothetical protein
MMIRRMADRVADVKGKQQRSAEIPPPLVVARFL